MKQTAIRLAPVEFIPESLDGGVLYVSRRFGTAVHLCACGCRGEVVTPLSPAGWRLREVAGSASLWPSIGNWSFSCQSHYWIRSGRVVWDRTMSRAQVSRVRARDRHDLAKHIAAVNENKSEIASEVEPAADATQMRTAFMFEALTRFLRRLRSR